MKYVRSAGLVTVVLGIGACAASDSEPVASWRLAAPDFEVGGVEADEEYSLTSLGGVTILDDGNVLVGDRSAPFLKVFGPGGDFVRSTGRFGSGPGEYEYVYELDWCAAGELRVRDVDGRWHRYSGALDFISTELISLDAIGGGGAYDRDCHPNGLEVVTGWGDTRSQFRPGLFEATAGVFLLRGQEVVRDFGERLSSQRLGSVRADGTPTGSGPHPLGRATVVALGSERVYIGDGADYEIEVYDLAGEPLPSIRWEGPSLEYDRGLVDILASEALAAASDDARPRLTRWYEEMPALEQIPAYDRVLVSDQDEVWVRHFVRPGASEEQWVVFGPAGDSLGRLELPRGARLWEVTGGRVVYSVLDDFDVPVVRISRIER